MSRAVWRLVTLFGISAFVAFPKPRRDLARFPCVGADERAWARRLARKRIERRLREHTDAVRRARAAGGKTNVTFWRFGERRTG